MRTILMAGAFALVFACGGVVGFVQAAKVCSLQASAATMHQQEGGLAKASEAGN